MIDAIILAAGQGTRMKSNKAKVLHLLGGKSLLQHVIDAINPLSASINIVIGNDAELVKNSINIDSINWVVQKKQLGTGHAVKQAIPYVQDQPMYLILYGDVPLITTSTLKTLISKAKETGFSLLSVILDDPSGYGRIVRDKNELIQAIIEHKDADDDKQKINEINTGIMAIKGSLLKKYISQLKPNNKQGELYLTDIVENAVSDNVTISSLVCDNISEVMGINNKNQLAEAERIYQQKQAKDLMSNGLTIKDPNRFDCRGNLIEAINNHEPAANKDANIPYTNRCGSLANNAASSMPLRIVAVTSPPARIAPENSKITAIIIACLIVTAPEPTDVPIALATSFAPIPQAMNTPKTIAIIINTLP